MDQQLDHFQQLFTFKPACQMQREIATADHFLHSVGMLLDQEINHFDGLVERTCKMQWEITSVVFPLILHWGVAGQLAV